MSVSKGAASWVGVVLLGAVGSAMANPTSCPDVKSIVQSPSKEGGMAYEVKTGAHQWQGEDPMSKARLDLSKLQLKSVALVPSKKLVVCDYEGGDEGIRLALEAAAPVAPAGGNGWACMPSKTEPCTFVVGTK